MNETDCRAVRREIDQSELGQRLSGQVESHVASCAACAEFRSQRSRLRELVGGLAPVTAPADFDLRLRARIARDDAARSRQPFIFRFVMSTPGIAVAALTVILVAGLVWFNQRTPNQTPNTVSTNGTKENQVPPVVPSVGPENPTGSKQHDLVAAAPTDKRPNVGRPTSKAIVDNAPRSSDFNSSPAEAVRLSQDRAGEVSLSAPVNPMVVTVRDEHGSHKILLPPVSFGSQRFTDSRVPVNMTNSRDW